MSTIIKKSLGEQIYKILKLEILTHKIRFGDILVNRALQERFNVSSSPIRDAMNRLFQDGLVEEITRSGAKIIKFNIEFAIEMNELLMTIINGAMDLSFKKQNNELMAVELKKYIEKQSKNINNDLYYDYNYRFYKTFFEYSHNKGYIDIFKKVNVLNELLVRVLYKDKKNFKYRAKFIQNRIELLNCVIKNDLEGAKSINSEHYLEAETLLKNILEI